MHIVTNERFISLIHAVGDRDSSLYHKLPKKFITEFERIKKIENYENCSNSDLIEKTVIHIVKNNDALTFKQMKDYFTISKIGYNYYFLTACEYGSLEVAQDILLHHSKYLTDFAQPIHRSAANGHLPVVQFLVDNKFNIHSSYDAPLRLAASYNRLEVIDYLLSKGANVSALNYDAFERIAAADHLESFKKCVDNFLLVEKNKKNTFYHKFKSIIMQHIEKYSNKNVFINLEKCDGNNSIILSCITYERYDMLQYLIDKDFNFDFMQNEAKKIPSNIKDWVNKKLNSDKLYTQLSQQLNNSIDSKAVGENAKNNDAEINTRIIRNKI